MVCLFVGLFDFWLILWCVHVVVVVVGGVRLRWWVCVWLVVVGLCVVGGGGSVCGWWWWVCVWLVVEIMG